ncbi:MAG TPA: hypothetical protein VNQ99_07950, partial [Xanthobacteraceae bacterium]|nr:hypothetical protein [Xanthobacteraceae bacterium]
RSAWEDSGVSISALFLSGESGIVLHGPGRPCLTGYREHPLWNESTFPGVFSAPVPYFMPKRRLRHSRNRSAGANTFHVILK